MVQLNNFTPLVDSLAKKYGVITAAVWGRVWRYEQMSDGACTASKETLADGLGVNIRTVARHIGKLIKDGYIVDHTPGLRNTPHTLNTTEKARIELEISAIDTAMTESRTGEEVGQRVIPAMTESHTRYDRESHEDTIKILKEDTKERDDKKASSRAPATPPAKKQKRPKKRDPRLDHPAMQAYNEIARRWPAYAVRDTICAVEDIEKWRSVVTEWVGRGYNPGNIVAMIEVYEKGWGRDENNASPRGF